MSIKKFLVSAVKSLIVLVVATFIFSSVTLNFPDLVKGIFGDIFAYASPEAQKNVINKLAETCSALGKGKEIITINQICANRSLLESMKADCADYRKLKMGNAKIENDANVIESCRQIESGEIEKQCNEMQKSSLLPDLGKIGDLCKRYGEGIINDREFFFNVVGGAMPSQMPAGGFFERYAISMSYLNSNKLIYFAVILVLLVLLYLLLRDMKLFVSELISISLNIGILIMLPYLVIVIYDNFVGIDTTPLLSGMFGEGFGIGPKALVSVILLLFLRTYTPAIIILGIVFLCLGIAGKIYVFASKRKPAPKKEIKESPAKLKKKGRKMP